MTGASIRRKALILALVPDALPIPRSPNRTLITLTCPASTLEMAVKSGRGKRQGGMETAYRVCGRLAWAFQECMRAMSTIRPGNKVSTQQKVGCVEVLSYSRHWPCLFPQHGPGRKHMRKIELQPWQRTIVAGNPGDFARGLFHSDGYRGINRVRARLAEGDH